MEQDDRGSTRCLPDVLTLRQAADLLRVRRRAVLLAVLTRALPSRWHGRRLVVPTQPLLADFGVPPYLEGDRDDDR